MIGPHEGKELELMLAGKKKMALFFDIAIPGKNIPEEIIPEKAFAPYVKNGTITRSQKNIKNVRNNDILHNVVFTKPGEEWRAQTVFWIKTEIFEHGKEFDEAYDIIIGRLLGYSENDILDFLSQ